MKFAYTGYDKSGAPAKGILEATSQGEAREALRAKGVFVTRIADDHSGAPATPAGAPSGGKAASSKHGAKRVSAFLKQLSLLVSSGTPVVEALGAVERQTADAGFKEVVRDIRQKVEEGSSLSEAMRAHPHHFDGVALSLVSAGESGASLDKMLLRLATILERTAQIRGAIIGAMIYPAVLTTVCLCVLVVMIVVVLPRFEGMFSAMNTRLPASTEVLIHVSKFLRAYWWGVGGGLIASVVGGVMYLKTPGGKRRRDAVLVRLPQIGALARALVTARIARILGLLVDSRVPMLTALDLTRRATGNAVYADLLATVHDAVERGEQISSKLGDGALVSASVCEAVRTGETTGRLGDVLSNIAEFMDRENEVVVRSLTSILEPVILLVMGALVGAVAVSMFLPLFDLAASTGGG
jgi:type II secretory pathway component PulF